MDKLSKLIKQIKKWSEVYEFSFQFWGEDNNNVFINKSGVELTSFGGESDIEGIFERTLEWVNKQNPKGFKPIEKVHRCSGCGSRIAKGNDFCGECMCEDGMD